MYVFACRIVFTVDLLRQWKRRYNCRSYLFWQPNEERSNHLLRLHQLLHQLGSGLQPVCFDLDVKNNIEKSIFTYYHVVCLSYKRNKHTKQKSYYEIVLRLIR